MQTTKPWCWLQSPSIIKRICTRKAKRDLKSFYSEKRKRNGPLSNGDKYACLLFVFVLSLCNVISVSHLLYCVILSFFLSVFSTLLSNASFKALSSLLEIWPVRTWLAVIHPLQPLPLWGFSIWLLGKTHLATLCSRSKPRESLSSKARGEAGFNSSTEHYFFPMGKWMMIWKKKLSLKMQFVI